MSGPVAKNHISIKNGRKIQCNTKNYEPIVVPGLSTGPSTSSASTSLTSFPQDTCDDSSSSPVNNTTSKYKHSGIRKPVAEILQKPKIQRKQKRTSTRYRETCCEI